MGNIGKGAAMYQSGSAFQRLYKIGFQSVLKKGRHGADSFQIGGRNGRIVVGVSDNDACQARFQIGNGIGQAKYRHDFTCYGNIESVLTRNAVGFSAKTVHNATQLTVIHVHTTLPRDATRINV